MFGYPRPTPAHDEQVSAAHARAQEAEWRATPRPHAPSCEDSDPTHAIGIVIARP